MKSKILILLLFLNLSVICFAQIDKAKELFYKDEYSAALKLFKKESSKNDSFEVQFYVASCYFKMEEFPVAKEHFLSIVNSSYLGVEIGFSMVNLASCYRELGKIDSSLYYYDWAIKLNPEDPESHFNKAQLLYSISRFEEAREVYNTVIELDSTNGIYYMKRQEISFILLDYSSALDDMLKAKKVKPDLDIDFNMAYCYSMMKRYKEADSLYQKIYDEKDALFLNNYGFNKHKLGQSEEGVSLIKKSIKLEPTNSYAYRNLAIIELDKGNTAKACEYLTKAKELNFFSHYGEEVDSLLVKHCK
ncbi:MAG: tetratricopeptide repeat protein [Fluviicola sp.]|nr:tetratricopeptide repeat protein [Fluviicola sp.]